MQAQDLLTRASEGCGGCALQLTAELGGLAWIQYMRWARRVETVNDSRKIFVRSRRWPECPWQVRNPCPRCTFFPWPLNRVVPCGNSGYQVWAMTQCVALFH
jgi:hypothetical protein